MADRVAYPVTYAERPISVPGVVLWRRTVGPVPELTPILPDGCMDLLWDGRRLVVAGPDSTTRRHRSRPGISYTALRFSGGTGPALLGIAADAVRDQTRLLEELWPSRQAEMLAEQVADDPAAALESWAVTTSAGRPVDPLGPRVLMLAETGTPVAAMADRLGLSARHLHRRCLPIFGYGPRRLSRVLRLGRAVGQARSGTPLAQVAAGCGYADQAHLCREVGDLGGTTPRALLRELGAGSTNGE